MCKVAKFVDQGTVHELSKYVDLFLVISDTHFLFHTIILAFYTGRML